MSPKILRIIAVFCAMVSAAALLVFFVPESLGNNFKHNRLAGALTFIVSIGSLAFTVFEKPARALQTQKFDEYFANRKGKENLAIHLLDELRREDASQRASFIELVKQIVDEAHVKEKLPDKSIKDLIDIAHIKGNLPKEGIKDLIDAAHIKGNLPEEGIKDLIDADHIKGNLPEKSIKDLIDVAHIKSKLPEESIKTLIRNQGYVTNSGLMETKTAVDAGQDVKFNELQTKLNTLIRELEKKDGLENIGSAFHS